MDWKLWNSFQHKIEFKNCRGLSIEGMDFINSILQSVENVQVQFTDITSYVEI